MAARAKIKNQTSPASGYWLSFEEYLKPKIGARQTSLLLFNKSKQKAQLRLKLLEHPILTATHKSKYERLMEGVMKLNRKSQLKLKRFSTFLHARNDKYVCKPKSNFEIYCEIASIHGFTNFVGATTLQRAFWFLVVLLAVIMSCSVLLVSLLSYYKPPTILYPATQYPAIAVALPAITICNLNRISKVNAETLARSFQNSTDLTINQLINYFKLALFSTENIQANASEYKTFNNILKSNNYTMHQLLHEIAPDCEKDLIKCSIVGNVVRCGYLFQQIETPVGRCCSLNYRAFQQPQNKSTTLKVSDRLFYISNSGYANGISVLLDPRVDDYVAGTLLTAGFQVLTHDVYDFADECTSQRIITPSTFNNIRFSLQQTFTTKHIISMKINARKCYLHNERNLFHFSAYSQGNCLAECRSLMFFEKCNCALPHRPKMWNWTVCGLEDAQCYFKYKYLLSSTLKHHNSLRHKEEFICDCYPSCDLNMYHNVMDSGQLSRKYSLTEKRLYEDINITDHILLRAFVGKVNMQRLRLDVSESWLSFLGTFGGITALHMGYSFLSGFELIFFALVRPACSWWTKKRIEGRNKRRIKAAWSEGNGNN